MIEREREKSTKIGQFSTTKLSNNKSITKKKNKLNEWLNAADKLVMQKLLNALAYLFLDSIMS